MKKMLLRIVHLFVLLLFLFLLNACGENPNGPVIDVNYYSGSDGLVFSFLPNNPPEKVYAGQTYPITLELENKGAFDLAPGNDIVTPWGTFNTNDLFGEINIVYDNLYFAEESSWNKNSAEKNVSLMGKSLTWPFGQNKMQIADIVTAQSLGQRSGAETMIRASLCYPYRTTLTQEVCIDKDPYGNADMQVPCHAEDISLVDQGAPIAITYIDFESSYLPGASDDSAPLMKPMFHLTLENVGDGQLVRARNMWEQKLCVRPKGDTAPSNAVKVYAKVAGKDLICSPEYPVFYNDKAEVICTLAPDDSIPVEMNHFEILSVVLTYVYQVHEELSLEIDDSFNQKRAVTMLDFKCGDFNQNYDDCRAFAQDNVAITTLNCYYCEANNRCMNENQKDECEAATSPSASIKLTADRLTRRFVAACPSELPSVSASFARKTNEVKFTCNDPSGVKAIDHLRCGCEKIQYFEMSDVDGLCQDIFSGTATTSLTEDTARSDIFAGLPLSDLSGDKITGLKNGESYALCYRAITYDNKITDIKKVSITQ